MGRTRPGYRGRSLEGSPLLQGKVESWLRIHIGVVEEEKDVEVADMEKAKARLEKIEQWLSKIDDALELFKVTLVCRVSCSVCRLFKSKLLVS